MLILQPINANLPAMIRSTSLIMWESNVYWFAQLDTSPIASTTSARASAPQAMLIALNASALELAPTLIQAITTDQPTSA